MRLRYLKGLLFVQFAGLAFAASADVPRHNADPAGSAVIDCARAIQARSGISDLTFVKRHTKSGDGNYSVWLNAQTDQKRGFCTTRAGEVSSVLVLDGLWTKTAMFQPRGIELTQNQVLF